MSHQPVSSLEKAADDPIWKDYLKSVWINKFTLAGFAGLVYLGANYAFEIGTGIETVAEHVGAIGRHARADSILQIKDYAKALPYLGAAVSALLLLPTAAGLETLKMYRAVKRHIREGSLDRDIIARTYVRSEYCKTSAIKFALKESGNRKLIASLEQ